MADRNDVNSNHCPFCDGIASRVIASNGLAFAIRDAFPVSPLHCLVIPRRHVEDWFGLTPAEREACAELLQELRSAIQAEDPAVAGFNIGMNAGLAAGQSIFHSHIHLIPRRTGDVEHPRGGVRLLMPRTGAQTSKVCPFGKREFEEG